MEQQWLLEEEDTIASKIGAGIDRPAEVRREFV
jgi:hypothetical protein